MGLMQAIEAQATAGPGPKCRFTGLYEQLSKKDAAELRGVLADRRFLNAQVFRALRAEGHDMPLSTLSRHRKGDCNCGTL